MVISVLPIGGKFSDVHWFVISRWIPRRNSTCFIISDKAMYSASIVCAATRDCSLEDHIRGFPPSVTKKPDHERQLVGSVGSSVPYSPAKSASLKALMTLVDDGRMTTPICFVFFK